MRRRIRTACSACAAAGGVRRARVSLARARVGHRGARNIRDVSLRVANVNSATLWFGSQSVPLDGKSNMLLRYRGPRRTFPYISAADVLSGAAAAGAFKDKIVFVGTTALGTREVVSTPLDTLFAGVEVQATVADNLLQQDYIRRPEYGVARRDAGRAGVGVVASLLVARFGLAWGGASVAAICRRLGRRGRADVGHRRVPFAAVSDAGTDLLARLDCRRQVRARAPPRGPGRSRQGRPRSA